MPQQLWTQLMAMVHLQLVLVFVLLLPLLGSIYNDTLAAQKESKMQIERMERLRQQLEYERQQMDRQRNEQK